MAIICRSVLLLLLTSLLFISFSFAEIRFADIRSDDRPIIPVDEFQFTHTGRLELNVSQVTLSNKNADLALSKAGFFLCTPDAWMYVLQQLVIGEITCALDSDLVNVVFDFRSLKGKSSCDAVFRVNDAERYTLVFANCLDRVNVSMTVRSEMYNFEGKQNRPDYLLSAVETILPGVYFLSPLVYLTLAGIWIYILYKILLAVS
ncbi:hypothetical protein like AT5G42090 [Hibiscus trionum]|uniref:CAND6/7 N-terminal domain-containing protein n=1 Tax=Hibiscus trionum TaxID=183268 RepID=A0A9W7MQE7_HIBTR|nr:hypothetical protein like AT5G42090 [Hibiscus trionum]